MTSVEIAHAYQTAEDRAKEIVKRVRKMCRNDEREMIGGLAYELECAYREIELLKAQRGE